MKYTLLLMLLFFAACSPTNETTTVPPAGESASVRQSATNTPLPTEIPDTPESRGLALFASMQPKAGFSCATCHYTNSESRLIGPGLVNLQERFDEYDLDIDLDSYLRQSILEPDHFITPGIPTYPAGVMPQNYADVFSSEQVDDLIAYLVSLQS